MTGVKDQSQAWASRSNEIDSRIDKETASLLFLLKTIHAIEKEGKAATIDEIKDRMIANASSGKYKRDSILLIGVNGRLPKSLCLVTLMRWVRSDSSSGTFHVTDEGLRRLADSTMQKLIETHVRA